MNPSANLSESPQTNQPLKGSTSGEAVVIESLGDTLHAVLVPAQGLAEGAKAPVLIVSHGAGEFHNNYYELAAHLAEKGISSLLMDMHGHGKSGGRPYHVNMREWVADIIAALDFLETRPDVDPKRIAAFGLSSGGTAILEAAVIDSRLRALVGLDCTVMNTLPLSATLTMKAISAFGWLKRLITGKDLRLSIVSMLNDVAMASDPEINARLITDPGKLAAFQAFPLPGAAQAFFVDTIKRVHKIKAPTLIIWGEDDELDPVSTAHALFKHLTSVKGLEIVAGNGHVGHLDRHRAKVFKLVADWLLLHLS